MSTLLWGGLAAELALECWDLEHAWLELIPVVSFGFWVRRFFAC